MWTFFKLFLTCSIAGLLAASLMWVFFWLTGVFEVPEGIKKLFGIDVHPRYQYVALNRVRSERQAGMVMVSAFRLMDSALFGSLPYANNSASGCISKLTVSPDRENMAPAHAPARN